MKNIIHITLAILFCNSLYSQILNQDASGNSSILVSGGSIGIDIKEALLKANYYSPTDRSQGTFFGIDFQGKNSSGTADLFSKDKFTPQSNISGTIGFHWSDINYENDFDKKLKISKKIDSLEKLNSELILILDEKKYIKEYATKIEELGGANIALEIRKTLSKFNYLSYQESISALVYKIGPGEKVDVILNTMKELIIKINSDSDFNQYKTSHKQLNKIRDQIKKIEANPENSTTKSKVYLRGGVNATEFKFDLMNNSGVFEDRFQDTLEAFGSLEIGYTTRFKQNLIGLSFTYKRISSFENLKKNTYTLTSIDTTLTDGQFSKKSDVIAFSGNYFKSSQSTIRLDLLHLLRWNQEDSKYLAIGGYFNRSFFGKGNQFEILENRSILGVSLSLIDGNKGQFNVGLYLQTNDLFNEIDNTPSKSISFGLTTKYVINNPINPKSIKNTEIE